MISPSSAAQAWLASPLGRHLFALESALVSQALDQVFGLQLLQIGEWGEPGALLGNARTQRQAVVGLTSTPGVAVRGDPVELCIAADSVDAVLLPHTLEWTEAPHHVLREIDRILVGEGHLVILGFNPASLWGFRRLVTRHGFPPGLTHFIAESRLRDWLSLLGFEVVRVRRYLHTLPVNRASLAYRQVRLIPGDGTFWSKLAGAYILLAQKRVYTLTPIRPKWRSKRRVVGGLVEPTTRNSID